MDFNDRRQPNFNVYDGELEVGGRPIRHAQVEPMEHEPDEEMPGHYYKVHMENGWQVGGAVHTATDKTSYAWIRRPSSDPSSVTGYEDHHFGPDAPGVAPGDDRKHRILASPQQFHAMVEYGSRLPSRRLT